MNGRPVPWPKPEVAAVWQHAERNWQGWARVLGTRPSVVAHRWGPSGLGFHRSQGRDGRLLGGPCLDCGSYVAVEDADGGRCAPCLEPVPQWKRAYNRELAAYMERRAAAEPERKRRLAEIMAAQPMSDLDMDMERRGFRTAMGDARREAA